MSATDSWIHLREWLLDWVFATGGRCPPNCSEPPSGNVSAGNVSADIAGELKRAMNRFKAIALSDDGSRVNYAALRDSTDYAEYRAVYLPRLCAFDPAALSSRADRLAFWVNVYNALVIDAVIQFGVQHSVTEGRLGLLRFFRHAAYAVGGQCVSCDDIEHGILRANRGHTLYPGPHFASDDPRRAWVIEPLDPRIHFALNCASRSCPPIGVYDADRIDAQLELAARAFVDQTTALDAEHDRLHISRIFKWYAGDFGGRDGVTAFLIAHLRDDERRDWLRRRETRARLAYHDYDWRLNV